ncbi:TetR/AcrR family transcriptional regulator [Streptomyces sp. NPDC005279]|uniref:TetR/AcrR family transcriptional regulator n=1 Tax=Streptomyces sp. NPDC005279 TaxID=3364712 RepID=UPI0036C47E77
MGHREDLLEGAKRCLLEKGYARTTARDIVAASGTNLASIGYHYGSKETLLNQAFLAVTEEWGDAVGPANRQAPDMAADPFERFEKTWEQVIAAADAGRQVWKLQLEVVSRLDDDEKLREAIKEPQLEGRLGMAEAFLGMDPQADPEKARVAGVFCQALVAGVMIQWMADPETAPSAKDLTDGLRAILEKKD